MNKSDLIYHIVYQYGYKPAAAKTVIDAIFNHIKDYLIKSEGRFIIENFGVFTVKARPPRNGVNPRTGEKNSTSRNKARPLQAE